MTLNEIVERERRGVARHLNVARLAWLTAGVLVTLVLAALVLADARWLSLPRIAPFVVWAIVIAGGWATYRWLHRRSRREASIDQLARAVEEERRLRAGSLRGVLEVAGTGALGRLGAEQMAERLHAIPDHTLAPAYRQRLLRRAGIGVVAAAAGIFGIVTAATAAPDGFRAVMHPVDAWRGTLLGSVTIDEVAPSVLRGESLTLSLRAPGRRAIQLVERVTGSSWRTRDVVLHGDTATVRLGPLDADITVYATDGRSTSDTVAVRVVDRPFLGDVVVRAEFPSYLGRRPETLPLGEVVRVPRGTALDIEGHSSTELQRVGLSHGGTVLPLQVQGRRFTGRLVASASGRFAWSATGVQGAIEDLPSPLELDVLPDSVPQVEIIAPSSDSTVSPNDTVNVSVLATDDHGLAGVQLRVVITDAAGTIRSTRARPMSEAGTAQFAGDLGVPTAELRPGDAMRLTAIATDGSPWRQVGTSREVVLRFPTLTEQRDAVRAAADSAVDRATAAANAQKQLNQRTTDAARARARETEAKDGAMSYEASEQAKQFAREQRQLADRMQQVQQAARELEKQLRQAGALDSALQDRLREAQRLMREALTPELAEKLRQLEQASQDMSPQDSRQALQELADQQRRLREQLDKSVEMLKRAALEGSMQTLKDDAQDLARRQRDLVDSLRKADEENERKAAEQLAKQLTDRAKDLRDDVQNLQKRLQQQQAEAGTERVKEAGEKIDESLEKLQQAMQERGQQQSGREPQGEAQQQSGQRQQGQRQQGQQQQGQQQQGQQQQGQQQQGQQGQQQQGQQGQQQQGQQGQQQQGQQGQQGQQQSQDKSGPGNQGTQRGEQSSSQAAEQAARSMEEAAQELSKAREQQIGEWKQELSGELDRSIQEMLQLAREQDQLEQAARRGAATNEVRAQQSALQQGVEKTMERLQDAGRKSNLLSQRSMRMIADARQKVAQATQQVQRAPNAQQMASAMRESSESLNQAAASLVRDRERTENANSATGFAELLEQMQEMARQQQGINSAMQNLMPKAGQQLSQEGQSQSRQLARQQREVAARLEDSGDRDASGRSEEMAREARQIAQQLESAQLDPAVLERQQRLFRKMLDAGRLLEEEEREDTGKREATPWTGTEVFTPSGANASGKAATRFTPPTWNDLRGLTPEERRVVLEYFKRINARP